MQANTISWLWPYHGRRSSRHTLNKIHCAALFPNTPLTWDGFVKQASLSEEPLDTSLLGQISSCLQAKYSHEDAPGIHNASWLQASVRSLFDPITPSSSFLLELNSRHPDVHFEVTSFTDSTHEILSSVMVSSGINAHVVFLKDIELNSLVPFDSSGIRNWIIELSGENFASIEETTKVLSNQEASSLLVLLEFVLHCKCGILLRKHRRKALRLLQKVAIEHHILPPTLELLGVVPAKHPFGGGGYSDVFKGSWNDETVCIKRLRIYLHPDREPIESHKDKVLQAFLKEALVWKQLKHPNILPFIGVSSACFPHQMSLISPYMKNGDIMDYLERRSWADKPTYAKRLSLLLGAARGMRYVHSMNLCHGDIKGANILINDDEEAQLADLGVSSVAASATETLGWETTSAGGFKGSLRWMSPEVILYPEPSMTTARDIYAFGSTMLEVITGKSPWSNIREDTKVILNLSLGKHPDRPDGFGNDVWNIIESCWCLDPFERPSATMVLERCESSLLDPQSDSSSGGPPPLPRPPPHQGSRLHTLSWSPGHTLSRYRYRAAVPRRTRDWEKIFLDVLESQNHNELRSLLACAGTDEIVPTNGPPLVSQAVVLALMHRLAAVAAAPLTTEEEFHSSLWWLNRCIFVLHPQDKLIADYISGTIPTIHQWINQAKMRVMVLSNGPGTIETSRKLMDMQEELVRKCVRLG
ncbi:kinase-like domain-containing protein [Flagelloscypha sp. PMI_526]|nr:kinase-like domain-containing protein [Flagelloscypha sp. PMI_526]